MKTFWFCVYFLFLTIQAFSAEVKPHLTVKIPMRDGKELATDLYLPSPDARGLPCILIRSPSGFNAYWKGILDLAKEGYVVAIQETRSALDKEGKSFPFIADGWVNYKIAMTPLNG